MLRTGPVGLTNHHLDLKLKYENYQIESRSGWSELAFIPGYSDGCLHVSRLARRPVLSKSQYQRRLGGFYVLNTCALCLRLAVADVREVFDLFDFWDGRDGEVDGFKVGDLLRCAGLNPTNAVVKKNGGTGKFGW